MEALFVVAAAGAVIAAGVWYYRAFCEARMWKEVHVVWGEAKKEKAVAIHRELVQEGIRAKLKTTSSFGITQAMLQSHTSIRVHREDFIPAAKIVLSFTRG